VSKINTGGLFSFIGAGLSFLEKGIDAGVNAYRAKFKRAVELLEWAYGEIERQNNLLQSYSQELEKLRKMLRDGENK